MRKIDELYLENPSSGRLRYAKRQRKEAYDPQRIPVLFVHGADGIPSGWKDMALRLDKERYQAWFYYYSSGIHIDASANILQGIIEALHDKHGFDRLYITAHSMGGGW